MRLERPRLAGFGAANGWIVHRVTYLAGTAPSREFD